MFNLTDLANTIVLVSISLKVLVYFGVCFFFEIKSSCYSLTVPPNLYLKILTFKDDGVGRWGLRRWSGQQAGASVRQADALSAGSFLAPSPSKDTGVGAQSALACHAGPAGFQPMPVRKLCCEGPACGTSLLQPKRTKTVLVWVFLLI